MIFLSEYSKNPLQLINQTGDFPYPTDAILDSLEDILVFSVDSHLQTQIDDIIKYLLHFLEFFSETNSKEFHLIYRILSLLHLMRPQIKYDSELIEEISFKYLENSDRNASKFSFIIIIDQFSSCAVGNPQKIEILYDWIFKQINFSIQNILNFDIDLLLLIVQSLKHLIDVSLYLFKNQSETQTINSIIIRFIDYFLKFVDVALLNEISPNMNILLSKILKLVARLIEISKTISLESKSILIKLQSSIKDTIEYSHIFQNYLLCLCILLFDNNSQYADLVKFFIKYILNNMHLFVYPPLNKRICILQYVSSLAKYIDNVENKNASNFQNIMPSIWPSLCNYHVKTIRQTTAIVQSLLTNEILNDHLTYEFLNQINASLEIIFMEYQMFDFHQKQSQFDSDTWIECNHHLIRLFYFILSKNVPQRPERALLNSITRLFKHVSFLSDQIGLITHLKTPEPNKSSIFLNKVSQKDYCNRTLVIFETFSKILSLFNNNILHIILQENIKIILPSQSHHIYHKKLHQIILKNIKDPNIYFLAFFSNITNRFDEIFMPVAQPVLLDLTRFVFIEAFLSENYSFVPVNSSPNNQKVKPANQQQITVVSSNLNLTNSTINSISKDLFRFILKGINSKDKMIIELLVTIFHSISQNHKTQRLAYFLNFIKQYQNHLSLSITYLSEDPNLQLLLSLFALFMFPLLYSIPSKSIEYWTNLFIHSIESDEYSLTALRFFCKSTLKTFVQLMQQLRRQMKAKLINKLITSLPRLKGKEINYPRCLLSKIPDYTSNNLMYINDPKYSHEMVLINDYYFYGDIVFNYIKKKSNPNNEDFSLLLSCLLFFIKNHTFYYCANSKFLNDLILFLSENSPDLLFDNDNQIINQINQLNEPKIYSFIFIKFRYFKVFNDSVTKPQLLIESLIQLLHSISTASAALGLIDILLYKIPFCLYYTKLNYILVSASVNEYKAVKQILDNHFLLKEIKNVDEKKISFDLFTQFTNFSTQSQKNIRKISLYAMEYFITKFGFNMTKIENQNQIIKDLPSVISKNKPVDYFHFILLYSFKDFPDSVSLINKLIESLSVIPIQNEIKEIRQLMKNIKISDSPTYSFSNAKFSIKLILHLFHDLEEVQVSMWEKFLILMRTEKFNFLISFLLKYSLKLKEFKSLPSELMNLFSTSNKLPQISCQLEDLLLLKFEITYSPINQTTEIINWIRSFLTNICSKPSKIQIIPLLNQAFEILKVTFMRNPKITDELKKCIYLSLDIALSSISPLEIDGLVEELFEISFRFLVNKLKSKFSINGIFLLCKLITNKDNVKFRNFCISNIDKNLNFLFAYFDSISANEFNYLLSTALLNLQKLVNDAIDESELVKIELISIRFFFKLSEKYTNFFYFKPALLAGFLEIFIPMKFVKNFIENSDLLNLFQNEILPLILLHPRIFYHPVFLSKFAKFMKEFPSIEIREKIFKNIEVMSTDNAFEKSFILAIVYEYYKNFHSEEEIEISIDFSTFSDNPPFPAILVNYMATSIGLLKNVNLIDAGECKTLLLLPHSHALGIKLKLIDLSTCFTLSRNATVSIILFSINPTIINQEELTKYTIKFLENIPFVIPSTNKSLLAIAKNLRYYQLSNKRFKQLILQYFTVNITSIRQQPDKYSIYYMPYFFKGLLEQTLIHDRMFELCLFCSVLLLTKRFDQQHLPVGQLLPSIIYSLLPKVNKDLINTTLIDKIQSTLSNFTSDNNSVADSIKFKLFLQLTSSLSEALFQRNHLNSWFFSDCLSPSKFLNSPFYTFLFPNYISTVQSCSKFDKMKTAFEITKRISIHFSKYIKSPQLKSPFASVAQWLNDINSINEDKIYEKEETQLKNLLEAMLPVNFEQMIFTLSTIKQPINRYALHLLEKRLKKDEFKKCQNYSSNPITNLIYQTKSNDLINDLFKFDWFSLDLNYHIIIFLKLIVDEPLINIINEMNLDSLKIIVSTLVNQIDYKNTNFINFIKFYVNFFPKSSLAESFWPSLILEWPLPNQTYLTNSKYLNQRNFPEDALGILKLKFPKLITAVYFHQLSSYKAAQYFYMKEMDEDNSCYFYALNELRKISFNLSLVLNNDLYDKIISIAESNKPKINLPFLKDYNGKFIKENFTSFSSSVYLPFLMHASLTDDVYHLLECLQKRIVPKPNSMCNFRLIKTLDKQNMMASNLIWKSTIYQELKNSLSSDINSSSLSGPSSSTNSSSINIIDDLIKKTKILLCKVLMRAGAIKSSMKQLVSSSQSNDLSRIAHINEWNVVYLMNFIDSSASLKIQIPNLTLIKINCQIILHNFKPPNTFNTLCYPFNKLWIFAVAIIHQFYPDLLDLPSFFSRLQNEISKSTSENLEYFLALALSVIRNSKNFEVAFKCFETSMLLNIEDKNKNLYLRWLPQFLYLFDSLPTNFIISLFNMQSSHFLLIANHAKYCNKIKNQNNFEEIMKKIINTKEGKEINEFNLAFKWLNICKDDIEQYAKACRCHNELYDKLKKNKLEEINEELVKFCDENPPIFKSNKLISSLSSFTGFKFPALPQRVMNVSLSAEGKREAVINFITAKDGGIRHFMLVSPRIYKYSFSEHLFIQCISRYIEHYPSSRTRPNFTFYPFVFLIHPELLMIHLSPSIFHLIPMSTQVEFGNFSKLFYESHKKVGDTSDASPLSMREKRRFALESIYEDRSINYNKLFLIASEHFKIQFLLLREIFVSHYAFYSSIRFIFETPLPPIPNLCIFGDAMRCCIPSFFQFETSQDEPQFSQIPITKMFTDFIPKYVIHGSFATTWNTVPNVFANHHKQLRVFLQGLTPRNTSKEKIDKIIRNSFKLALPISEITDKSDSVFPFELLDHLINCSKCSLHSQPLAYSWL